MEPQLAYQSYVLRLWRIQDGQQRQWRASLTHVGTGRQYHFADLDALINFLATNAKPQSDDASDDPPHETNKGA